MTSDLSAAETVSVRSFRAAQLVRAGVLIAVGVAIAFTAPLHRDLNFDTTVMSAGLALIGAATLLEYFAIRGSSESWWVAARAIVAIAAAGSMFVVTDTATLALLVALWAALTAFITLMRLSRGVQSFKIALPSLLLSVALAVTAFLSRQDPVALIGFFGAYAIIRGVFLGIAAFDHRTDSGSDAAVEADAIPTSAQGAE